MSWHIQGLVLPMEPMSIIKSTQRTGTQIAVTEGFPSSAPNQPTKFELTIRGYIFPKSYAEILDEITKTPDTTNIVIKIDEETEHQWLSGNYSISQSSVSRDKPLYDALTGGEVYEYNITFLKEAEGGNTTTGGEGGSGGGETGTGTQDFAGIMGFDKNGDGDIDFDELFNWFTNIMTFGIFK